MFPQTMRLGLFLSLGCLAATAGIVGGKSETPVVRAALVKRAHAGMTLAHVLQDRRSTDVEPKIRIVRGLTSASRVKVDSIFNVHTSFVSESPASVRYTLEVFLVDEDGKQVGYAQNSLEDKQIILPTNQWQGPVSITMPLVAPSSSKGPLKILAALRGPNGRVTLANSSDFKPDSQARYPIGVVSLDQSGPEFIDAPSSDLDLSRYQMTFDDEFQSLSISDAQRNDGSKWYALNEQCCMMATDGAKTQMSAAGDVTAPFSLASPKGLNIHLRRKGNVWSSGVLTSVDSKGVGFSQQYGYFEMRAKFPQGNNTWPAFWLLNTAAKSGAEAAGEIDIVEYIANHGFPRSIATTLHDWKAKTTPAMSHHMVALPTDGFHRYGMLWTMTTMTFYFDGIITFQCPTPSIMRQPYYLIVDLGLGGGWPTETTPPENTLTIDYVRVYRERGTKPEGMVN